MNVESSRGQNKENWSGRTEIRKSKRSMDGKKREKGTGEEKAGKIEGNRNKESGRRMGNLG